MVGNFNEPFGPKWVEVVIVGKQLSADRASEIIRRTDGGFQMQLFPVSEYGQTVRDLVGFPIAPESNPDHWAARDAVASWRARWGGISLKWLGNSQLLHNRGWCHVDGTIAFAGELEDYPRANELLEDCQLLAAAFPDLDMTVAAWGDDKTILGLALEDAPESPWPQTLLENQIDPTFEFLISDGTAKVLPGEDPILFKRRYGLDCPKAVEWALSESRRCAKEAVSETAFGDRGYYPGLPDSIIHDWRVRAQSLGLVD